MQRLLTHIALLVGGLLLLQACEEVGPAIRLTETRSQGDTTYVGNVEAPQNKVVLIEDFSGLACANCPKAHETSRTISENNTGRVVVVTLINYPFDPLGGTKEDYVTQEAVDIDKNLIGPAAGWPTGAVDRTKFPGEQEIIVPHTSWANYTTNRLQATTPVNIYLEKNYNETDRLLKVRVEVRYTEAVTEEHRLSVSLTEDSIIDKQKDVTTTIQNYVHRHMERAMLTPFNGTPLSSPSGFNEPGRVFVRYFETTLADHWKAEHFDIVAFVHQSGAQKEVVHVAKVHLR